MKDGMSVKAKIFTPCVFVSLYITLNTSNSQGFRRFGTDFLQVLFRKIKTRKSPVNTEIARKWPVFDSYPPCVIPRIFA